MTSGMWIVVEKNNRYKIEIHKNISEQQIWLEHIYKPRYDYQNFPPLANGTDLDRQKYTILQTHWHYN